MPLLGSLEFRKSLSDLIKIGFVLRDTTINCYPVFALPQTENCSVSPRRSATLVAVQLTQFWQHSPDGLSGSFRLVWRYRRRRVDEFRNDQSPPAKRINEPDHLGRGEPRRIELSERRRALNQGNLGPPHPREVKFRLRDSAGALQRDGTFSVAGDFAREFVQLFRKRRG